MVNTPRSLTVSGCKLAIHMQDLFMDNCSCNVVITVSLYCIAGYFYVEQIFTLHT